MNDKYLKKHIELYKNRDETSANIKDNICKRFKLEKQKSESKKQEELMEKIEKYITSESDSDSEFDIQIIAKKTTILARQEKHKTNKAKKSNSVKDISIKKTTKSMATLLK